MPTRDWRTVGELLVDSDALAREALVDFSPEAAPAMLRTFVQVTQSAARLWSVLPPTSLAPIPQPELMVRLQAVGRGIGRSVSLSRWPGQGPTDERLEQVAYNLSRAAVLVERHGRDVQPTTRETRADIAAAQARVMHTLYVAAHGTSMAVTSYANALQDQLDTAARRKSSLSARPEPRDISAARAMHDRLDVFEQLAGTYVAAHPVTLAALGEVAVPALTTRLDFALARWDIQAHRTLAASPSPADLGRVARVQALIATTTAVVTEATSQQGKAEPAAVQQLTPALDATQVAWTKAANRWSELTARGSRPDPALGQAASEVRAAIAATAHTHTGWASPDQLAARVDLVKTVETLQLGMVAGVDLAHLTREVAAVGQSLVAPARAIAPRAQTEAEVAQDQGATRYEGQTWVTPAQLASNQSLTFPEPVRRGLVDLADDVIATATRAVAGSAFLANERAKTAIIPSTSSTGRTTQARHAASQRPPEGPRR